jgi:hypothetical protein
MAALVAGWTASALPFYPSPGAPLLAVLAALAALVRPRAGLAVALAVPVLPLGNVALGLAIVYGLLAAGWLVLFAREPRGGLLAAVGPLLAPLGALGLLPLALVRVRSPVRRAAAAAGGVLLAGLVAGLRGVPLPFDGAPPPVSLGIAGRETPGVVAGTLLDTLVAHPTLALEAAALAVAAAALPYARSLGPWGVAGFGAAFLAATLLSAPGIPAAPLVLAVWATCAVLVLPKIAEPPLGPELDSRDG